MPSRPTSVTLGPHTFALEFVEEMSQKGLLGKAHRVEGTVEISTQQAPSVMRSTVLHELIHQALWAHGSRLKKKDEEAVCLALEGPLLELFARPENAALRKWLVSP